MVTVGTLTFRYCFISYYFVYPFNMKGIIGRDYKYFVVNLALAEKMK